MRRELVSQTVRTYDNSAVALSEYFSSIGPRVVDIERGIELSGVGRYARVVEIGCGDGRDAAEIVSRISSYEGFDPSEGLLNIARRKLPSTSFVLADALSYGYPWGVDIVFAFASLLHINKEDLKEVFSKVAKSLGSGGIFYISLKERKEYTEEIKRDEYGERIFYYYYPDLIKQIAGDGFLAVWEDRQTIEKTDWFTIALKKN